MVPSMHCDITLFIVTIVEVHVLIYDDFVCYWSFVLFKKKKSLNWFCNTVDV